MSQMSPPRPPSPPDGPPRGTNFSRRNAVTPLPPCPGCVLGVVAQGRRRVQAGAGNGPDVPPAPAAPPGRPAARNNFLPTDPVPAVAAVPPPNPNLHPVNKQSCQRPAISGQP